MIQGRLVPNVGLMAFRSISSVFESMYWYISGGISTKHDDGQGDHLVSNVGLLDLHSIASA